MNVAEATRCYAAYLNAPRGVLPVEEDEVLERDTQRAREAMERAWLEAKPTTGGPMSETTEDATFETWLVPVSVTDSYVGLTVQVEAESARAAEALVRSECGAIPLARGQFEIGEARPAGAS